MDKNKPILVEQFADNGGHSHWHLVNKDGEVLWSSFPEETIARGEKIIQPAQTEDTIELLKKLSESREQ